MVWFSFEAISFTVMYWFCIWHADYRTELHISTVFQSAFNSVTLRSDWIWACGTFFFFDWWLTTTSVCMSHRCFSKTGHNSDSCSFVWKDSLVDWLNFLSCSSVGVKLGSCWVVPGRFENLWSDCQERYLAVRPKRWIGLSHHTKKSLSSCSLCPVRAIWQTPGRLSYAFYSRVTSV